MTREDYIKLELAAGKSPFLSRFTEEEKSKLFTLLVKSFITIKPPKRLVLNA